MRKKTIAFFFIMSWLLVIISFVLLFEAVLSTANMIIAPHPSITMNGSSINARITGAHIVSQVNFGFLYAGLILLIFAGLFYMISWIGALVATVKRSNWGWFFCIFFFQWFAEMIYLFVGPAVNISVPPPVKGHEHDTAFRGLREPAVVNFLAPTPVRVPKTNPFL